jgi:hypothetical protein
LKALVLECTYRAEEKDLALVLGSTPWYFREKCKKGYIGRNIYILP